MAVWDEEWEQQGEMGRCFVFEAGPKPDRTIVEVWPSGGGKDQAYEVAKLAAAAPAMARLLLRLEWPEPASDSQPVVCHFCRREHPDEDRPGPEAHAPDCAWVAVMRAAGVRD